jgi:hypothetical protein
MIVERSRRALPYWKRHRKRKLFLFLNFSLLPIETDAVFWRIYYLI